QARAWREQQRRSTSLDDYRAAGPYVRQCSQFLRPVRSLVRTSRLIRGATVSPCSSKRISLDCVADLPRDERPATSDVPDGLTDSIAAAEPRSANPRCMCRSDISV